MDGVEHYLAQLVPDRLCRRVGNCVWRCDCACQQQRFPDESGQDCRCDSVASLGAFAIGPDCNLSVESHFCKSENGRCRRITSLETLLSAADEHECTLFVAYRCCVH